MIERVNREIEEDARLVWEQWKGMSLVSVMVAMPVFSLSIEAGAYSIAGGILGFGVALWISHVVHAVWLAIDARRDSGVDLWLVPWSLKVVAL